MTIDHQHVRFCVHASTFNVSHKSQFVPTNMQREHSESWRVYVCQRVNWGLLLWVFRSIRAYIVCCVLHGRRTFLDGLTRIRLKRLFGKCFRRGIVQKKPIARAKRNWRYGYGLGTYKTNLIWFCLYFYRLYWFYRELCGRTRWYGNVFEWKWKMKWIKL